MKLSEYGTLPGELETLAMIMEMNSRGMGGFTIAMFLEDKKVKPRGKRWQGTSINRIIQREGKTRQISDDETTSPSGRLNTNGGIT